MNGSVVAANRALAARGYSPEEARVEPAPGVAANHYRLVGTMLVETETGPIGYLLRLVTLMPERDVLEAARSQWDPTKA